MKNEKLRMMNETTNNRILLLQRILKFIAYAILHFTFFILTSCLSRENSQLPQLSILLDTYKFSLSGQSNTGTDTGTGMYTIGGLVGGLTSGTLSLQNNGGNNLSRSVVGSFQFSTPF